MRGVFPVSAQNISNLMGSVLVSWNIIWWICLYMYVLKRCVCISLILVTWCDYCNMMEVLRPEIAHISHYIFIAYDAMQHTALLWPFLMYILCTRVFYKCQLLFRVDSSQCHTHYFLISLTTGSSWFHLLYL